MSSPVQHANSHSAATVEPTRTAQPARYLPHAPDLLGLPDAITLAQRLRGVVERGLSLKKAGNAIMVLTNLESG